MKNILNNRILVILSIFVILITSLCTSCFASDDIKYTYNGVERTVPDFSHRLVDGGTYCLAFILDKYSSGEPLPRYWLFVSNQNEQPCFGITDDGIFVYRYTRAYYCNFLTDQTWLSYNSDFFTFTSDLGGKNKADIIQTDFKVYKANYTPGKEATFTDEVVFPVAPQIPEITKTLVEQTTQTQIQEQLKLMITGFLKYLIVFVISVIAFWKGWKFLSKQLKRA